MKAGNRTVKTAISRRLRIKRVLTDNESCYRDQNFQTLLFHQRVKHRFTRPYTPRTNGKAERFIKTAINEWAYARTYQNSEERQAQLEPWLHDYNFHRPHRSLNHNTPASRAGLNRNNLLTLHTWAQGLGTVSATEL